MAYARRNQSEDIRANRAWTADDVADLSDIPAKHGDAAYVTATSHAYVYVDGGGWINLSSAGDVSDGDTLSTGLTFPNTGLHILDTNGSHDLIIAPGSNITADRTLTVTTGDADRALTISGDVTLSGGTHSGTNTGDVTLAGTPTYITIANQVITRSAIDVTGSDITGVLPASSGGTGVNLNPTHGQLLAGVTGSPGTFALVNAGATNEVLQGFGTSLPPGFVSVPSLEGIAFPATQVASADANTLDDYEEGTWTPVLSTTGTNFTSVTYDTQSGTYVKIGSLVVVQFAVKTDAVTVGSASGNVTITGLPFTAALFSTTAIFSFSWASNNPALAYVGSGNNYIELRISNAVGNLAVADVATGADANFAAGTIAYRV